MPVFMVILDREKSLKFRGQGDLFSKKILKRFLLLILGKNWMIPKLSRFLVTIASEKSEKLHLLYFIEN